MSNFAVSCTAGLSCALLRFEIILLHCAALVSGMLPAVNLAAHDGTALIRILDTLLL